MKNYTPTINKKQANFSTNKDTYKNIDKEVKKKEILVEKKQNIKEHDTKELKEKLVKTTKILETYKKQKLSIITNSQNEEVKNNIIISNNGLEEIKQSGEKESKYYL